MSQTVFKEPKSSEFVDIDGWIFNDLSSKHFKKDKQDLLKGLDQIACKINLIFFIIKQFEKLL